MRNLISANLYRLIHSKVFYIGILAAVVMEVYTLLTGYKSILLENLGLEKSFFFYPILLVIEMPAFCGLFFGAEYSGGTLRSKLVVGISRWKIYTSNLVTGTVASLAFSATAIVTGMAVGFPLVGGFHLETGLLASYLICSLAIGVASAAFSIMLSMVVSNRAVGLVIGVLTAFSLLFLGQFLLQSLEQPELTHDYKPVIENGIFIGYAYNENAPLVPNPKFVGGALRTVCIFLLHLLPEGQCFLLLSFMEVGKPWQLLVGSALFTALTTAVGLVVFQKKDIK